MAGDVAKALHLLLLGQQGEEGVEHHVDQRIYSLDGHVGEVAHGHWHGVAAGLSPQLGHHRLRRVDAVNVDAPALQGQSDAARADAQLQSRAALRQLGQRGHGCLVIRCKPLVVHAGDALSVGGWLILHA